MELAPRSLEKYDRVQESVQDRYKLVIVDSNARADKSRRKNDISLPVFAFCAMVVLLSIY